MITMTITRFLVLFFYVATFNTHKQIITTHSNNTFRESPSGIKIGACSPSSTEVVATRSSSHQLILNHISSFFVRNFNLNSPENECILSFYQVQSHTSEMQSKMLILPAILAFAITGAYARGGIMRRSEGVRTTCASQ